MRRIAAAIILFLLLAPLPGSYLPRPAGDRSAVLTARPAPGLLPGRRVGALTLVEAWELDSPDERMGGLSGLIHLGPRDFLAVADRGFTLRFALGADETVSKVRFDTLPQPYRDPARKRLLDAEAVTRDARTGRYWVALERLAEIWRFSPDGKREGRLRNPAIARWPTNGAAEALVRLSDRRFLVLSERAINGDAREGILFAGDPLRPRTRWLRFAYDSGDLGAPTDAAALPDGRVLILHRQLGSGPLFRTSLALADPRPIKAGDRMTSIALARFDDRDLAENYEGLAVSVERGNVMLWILSDNNQNHWQRTRLLKFQLDPAALAR